MACRSQSRTRFTRRSMPRTTYVLRLGTSPTANDSHQYMASRGHRVIACAQALLSEKEYPADHPFSRTEVKYPSSGYCFVGLVSLEDPPKSGVRQAIGKLRLAGIKVMMVTG